MHRESKFLVVNLSNSNSVTLLMIGCLPRSHSNPESISPSQTMEQSPKLRTEVAAQTLNQQSYVGMWVTKDGYIRHELLPNGRYDEARGHGKLKSLVGYFFSLS